MSPRRRTARVKGFTLIEVVVSAALMAMILVSAYLCLNAGIVSQKLIEPRIEIFQNARVALALLSADLRAACPLSTNYQFIGEQRTVGEAETDTLDFGTHNFTPQREGQGDFCQESIYIERDVETGSYTLWRRRNPVIGTDPFTGGTREEIAEGLTGLQLEYYDGYDWYSTWGDLTGKGQTSNRDQPNLTGMPEAVRITLLFDSNPSAKRGQAAAEKTSAVGDSTEKKSSPTPLVFQTVARLILADRPQGKAAAGDSTGSDSSGNQDSSGPGAGNGGVM